MNASTTHSRPLYWHRIIGLVLTVIVLLSLLGMAPAPPTAVRAQPQLLTLTADRPAQTVNVIVQKLGTDTGVEDLVTRLGGEVTRDLHIINAFAARVPVAAVTELAQSPGVRWVSLDAPMVSTASEMLAPEASEVVGVAACGGSVSLEAVADTHIRLDKPDKTAGEDSLLRTRPTPGKEAHSLIRFELGDIPTNAGVQSATLVVTSNSSRDNHVVEVREASTSWREQDARWNSPDGNGNGMVSVTPTG